MIQVLVEELWQDLLAEVQRVSREIERDNQGEFAEELMVGKGDAFRELAQSSVAPRVADPSAVDVDQSSEDSFPASDPPAWAPLHVGAPRTVRVSSPPVIPAADRSGRSA